MNKVTTGRGKQKLTLKQRKLVKAKIEGKTNLQAYEEAGYSITGKKTVDQVNAFQAVSKPHIQQVIEEALQAQGLTAEWAVAQLGKVAAQDDEIGAKRLAAKDILELHGWNKTDRPTVQLQVKNAFFQGGRNTDERQIVDADETTITESI